MILFVWVYVCAQVDMCVWVVACIHIHVHMYGGQIQPWVPFLSCFPYSFLRWNISLSQSLPWSPGWLASESQDSHISISHSSGINSVCRHTQIFLCSFQGSNWSASTLSTEISLKVPHQFLSFMTLSELVFRNYLIKQASFIVYGEKCGQSLIFMFSKAYFFIY